MIATSRRAPRRLRESQAPYAVALPGPLYCDTSALLKLYLPEPGSDQLNRILEGRDDLVVSDLAVTEVASAVGRRVRQQSLTSQAARRVLGAIIGRQDDGTYHRVELTRDVHRRAEHLLLTLTQTPLRAADALHLALAGAARAASMISFDGRLAAAARAAGLTIHPGTL